MAKVTFSNGKIVNFNGNPTQQDIEDVSSKFGISTGNDSKQTASPSPFSSPTPSPSPTPQGGGVMNTIENGIGNFVKSAISPVATMAARPIQAAAELSGVSDEDVNKATQNIAGDLVAPTPKNMGDVEKDVGRGAETVALGLDPVAGGALYGAGNSVEQGNDILSKQTALQGVLGGVGGKVIDAASPIIGKVLGKVTPRFVKDIGGKVGDVLQPPISALSDFAKNTDILPTGISKAVNATADTVNSIPSNIGNVVKNQWELGGGQTRGDALNMVQKVFGSTGKKSAGVLAGEPSKMLNGAETLVDNAPKLKVTDENGTQIPYDPTTATPVQHVEALNNGKKQTWNELEKNLKSATGQGVTVDTTPTQDELQSILNNNGRIAEHGRASELLGQIKQLNTPSEINDYLVNLNAGNQGVANGSSQAVNKKLDYEITQKLSNDLDGSILDTSDDSKPIHDLKQTYSGYKSVENSLVNLAKKSINKKDSILGGGLMDYANSYNLGEIFSHVASGNPIGAAGAMGKTALLNKIKGDQTPEAMLNKLFTTISNYKGIAQQGLKKGVTENLAKNLVTGGGLKFPSSFLQNNQ